MVENTSGHGEYAVVPDEIIKWNWGAFWLTWIWGIGNRSYIALLSLLPIANLIMPFYLGKRGNELAWKNNRWYDIEELHHTQKKWAIAGWIIGLLFIAAIIGNGVAKYQKEKESERIALEVMEIVMKDKEANGIIDENYEIIHKGPISTPIRRNKIIGYNIIIRSNNEIYSVYAYIGKDKEIKSVKVSEFGKDGNLEIIISNE